MGLFDTSPLAGLLTGYLPTGIENMQQGNQAIRQGAQATLKKMRGQELAPEEQAAIDDSPIGGMGVNNIGAAGAFMGTFAGRLAATANKAKMNQALRLENRGLPMEDIRQKTGWGRGPDNEWKFEVSDHNAELRLDKAGTEILHHPELRRAYPDLINTLKIERFDGPADMMGRYDPDTNTIHLNRGITDPHQAVSIALHEMQHPIQIKEGFSTGASMGMAPIQRITTAEGSAMRARLYRMTDGFHDDFQNWMAPRLNRPKYKTWNLGRFQEEFDRLHPEIVAERDQAWNTLNWMDTPRGTQQRLHSTYERAMGEYEARETQRRMDMTPDQRLARAPYNHDQAIPQDRLIDMRRFPGENGVPPTVPELTRRRFPGLLTPEQGGMALSLLGIPLMPNRAE